MTDIWGATTLYDHAETVTVGLPTPAQFKEFCQLYNKYTSAKTYINISWKKYIFILNWFFHNQKEVIRKGKQNRGIITKLSRINTTNCLKFTGASRFRIHWSSYGKCIENIFKKIFYLVKYLLKFPKQINFTLEINI